MKKVNWVEKFQILSILTIQHWINTPFSLVMYKIWIKSINFPKFDCVIAISLSISLTNTVAYTVKVNRQVSQAFTIKHSCQIQSVKPFLGRQFWHQLHRMHFGASQNCRQNPRAFVARASATGTSPIREHHPPHLSKEIDTPGVKCIFMWYAIIFMIKS